MAAWMLAMVASSTRNGAPPLRRGGWNRRRRRGQQEEQQSDRSLSMFGFSLHGYASALDGLHRRPLPLAFHTSAVC